MCAFLAGCTSTLQDLTALVHTCVHADPGGKDGQLGMCTSEKIIALCKKSCGMCLPLSNSTFYFPEPVSGSFKVPSWAKDMFSAELQFLREFKEALNEVEQETRKYTVSELKKVAFLIDEGELAHARGVWHKPCAIHAQPAMPANSLECDAGQGGPRLADKTTEAISHLLDHTGLRITAETLRNHLYNNDSEHAYLSMPTQTTLYPLWLDMVLTMSADILVLNSGIGHVWTLDNKNKHPMDWKTRGQMFGVSPFTSSATCLMPFSLLDKRWSSILVQSTDLHPHSDIGLSTRLPRII